LVLYSTMLHLDYYPVPCPFFALAIAFFIYYTSISAGTEARTELK